MVTLYKGQSIGVADPALQIITARGWDFYGNPVKYAGFLEDPNYFEDLPGIPAQPRNFPTSSHPKAISRTDN